MTFLFCAVFLLCFTLSLILADSFFAKPNRKHTRFYLIRRLNIGLLLLAIFSIGCKKTDINQPTSNKPLPSITTNVVSVVAQTSALASGVASSDSTILDRGFCYSTAANPTIAGNKISCGKGSGSFSGGLKNLPGNATIYVRAYATDVNGTGYGNQQTFKTPAADSAITMYLNGDSTLFSINAGSGALKWRVNVGGHITSTPEYGNNTVFVCVNNNQICAFDTTAHLKWTAQIPVPAITDTLSSYQAKIKFYNNILFVAPANQSTLFAINATTGAMLWTHAMTGRTNMFTLDFIFDGSSVYINCGYYIDGVDVETGQKKMTINSLGGNSGLGAILVLNNKLYSLVAESFLYAFDKNSGATLWYKSYGNDVWTGGGAQISYNGYALYCTFSDGIGTSVTEAVDTINGSKIFSISNVYLASSVQILSDNILYFLPNGETVDAFSGLATGGDNGGLLTNNGGVIVNHKKYSANSDAYGIANYIYGSAYCFNYLTQLNQWTSTFHYNFIFANPCVVTQSGKVYR